MYVYITGALVVLYLIDSSPCILWHMKYSYSFILVLYLLTFLYCGRINLEGHRPRVRRYAHELKKLIKIGQGDVACAWLVDLFMFVKLHVCHIEESHCC